MASPFTVCIWRLERAPGAPAPADLLLARRAAGRLAALPDVLDVAVFSAPGGGAGPALEVTALRPFGADAALLLDSLAGYSARCVCAPPDALRPAFPR